jgi:magnesium-protoporphyrin O-methyltransferase
MHFDPKVAAKDLREYRKDGPKKATQVLIDALIAENVSEMTLLDIGGGIGAVQHELLKAGAKSAINAEASSAYIETAKEEAERQGHAERITHLLGDFVDLAEDIPQCDIVTLDGVICCYHDAQGLVEKSIALAKSVLGVIYPHNKWWAKVLGALDNVKHRLKRSPFRFFVHPTEMVEEIVRKHGFERVFYQEMSMWQIVVWRRVNNTEE